MSLLWVTAVRPRPTGKLPQEEGLYWRLHHRDRPFSTEDATSQPFYSPDIEPDDDSEEAETARAYFAPREGYSAYASPHHLHQYATERNLMTHAGDVIAFYGRQVGFGHDDEPLVMPTAGKPFMRMPWGDFERRLRRTHKPGHPLDLDPDDGRDWFGAEF